MIEFSLMSDHRNVSGIYGILRQLVYRRHQALITSMLGAYRSHAVASLSYSVVQ